MSLNFDFRKMIARVGQTEYERITTSLIKNEEGTAKWHDVTNSLIWLSMGVGLGEITEKNVDEWCFRIALLEKLDGPTFQFNNGRKVSMTRKDIWDHIGMTTNVSDEKRPAWIKRVIEGSAYRLKLASGEPEAGLAISAFEQVNLIHREHLAQTA